MLQNAIMKLRDEMAQNANNSYIQVVGDFLLQHLEKDPAAAEKIITADKTITKSLAAMKEVARKKQSGGCAVLTDAEGFALVLEYFGVDGQVSAPTATATATIPPTPAPVAPVSKATEFDVKLEDLL